MRLWLKNTLICVSVIFFCMTIVAGIILMSVSNSLYKTDEENARKALSMYCNNITSVSTQADDYRDTTLKSVVGYYFSTYARLAQTDELFYSLSCEGDYIFDTSPFNPKDVFGSNENPEAKTSDVIIKRTEKNGAKVILGSMAFKISETTFNAYIGMDVTGTQNQINSLWVLSITFLLCACVIAAILVAILMRRAVKPLEGLTDNATAISQGNYHLRTNYSSRDEVGTLSTAFDNMAQSIEEKINTLDAELHNRELLLGALSHEIKTPMTAIIGYADSLLRMPLSPEQRSDCVRKIYESSLRTESLSQKMMELVGLVNDNAISKKQFETSGFVKAFCERYSFVEFSIKTEKLFGDEVLLYSLVANLIDNALKASGTEPQITVELSSDSHKQYIVVSDKGCGISSDKIPLLTQPFYRVDKARARKDGGAGLGLAICQKICEYHGGTLSIESGIGAGTTITATMITI